MSVADVPAAVMGADGAAGGITEPGSGGLGTVVGTVALAGEPGCCPMAAETVRKAAEQRMREIFLRIMDGP